MYLPFTKVCNLYIRAIMVYNLYILIVTFKHNSDTLYIYIYTNLKVINNQVSYHTNIVLVSENSEELKENLSLNLPAFLFILLCKQVFFFL